MVNKNSKMLAIFLYLVGSVYCISSNSSSESSESDKVRTPPTFFQYKVKALNTALYYILQALHDDLEVGEEIDINFLIRINIIMTKIKSFYGEVDETNALMLGEILRTLPGYLKAEMSKIGLNFNDYTGTPPDGYTLATNAS